MVWRHWSQFEEDSEVVSGYKKDRVSLSLLKVSFSNEIWMRHERVGIWADGFCSVVSGLKLKARNVVLSKNEILVQVMRSTGVVGTWVQGFFRFLIRWNFVLTLM